MNAGKSLDLLKVAYNYEERGQEVLLLTSGLDNRYGLGKITSRVGLEKDAIMINKETNVLDLFKLKKTIKQFSRNFGFLINQIYHVCKTLKQSLRLTVVTIMLQLYCLNGFQNSGSSNTGFWWK